MGSENIPPSAMAINWCSHCSDLAYTIIPLKLHQLEVQNSSNTLLCMTIFTFSLSPSWKKKFWAYHIIVIGPFSGDFTILLISNLSLSSFVILYEIIFLFNRCFLCHSQEIYLRCSLCVFVCAATLSELMKS